MSMDPFDTHPDELLADYVEGSLPSAERQEVESHLSSCETCRAEIELAKRARSALQALPELPVPMGTTRPVVDRARGRVPNGRLSRALWPVAGAAAAAVVGLLLWATINGGGPHPVPGAVSASPGAAPSLGTGAAGTATASGSAVTHQWKDYTPASIRRLAESLAGAPTAGGEGPAPSPAIVSTAPVEGPAATSAAAPRSSLEPADNVGSAAATCLQRAGVPTSLQGHANEIIEARFEGQPAYLGAYAYRRPSGPEVLAVWVASRRNCTLLQYVAIPFK